MTKKDKRDLLFKRGRPVVRMFHEDDLKWILASESEKGEEITDQFVQQTKDSLSVYDEIIIIEDINTKFGSGVGVVAMVASSKNDFVCEPHIEFFEWATTRNKLASTVSYLHKLRYSKLNTAKLKSNKDTNKLLSLCNKYLPIVFGCRIPGGDEMGRGDEYIYYMKCRGV